MEDYKQEVNIEKDIQGHHLYSSIEKYNFQLVNSNMPLVEINYTGGIKLNNLNIYL